MIDFKLPVVIEHENGTTEYHVRVYQGAVTTEDEGSRPVTRYRRSGRVQEFTLTLPTATPIRNVQAHIRDRIGRGRAAEWIPEQKD